MASPHSFALKRQPACGPWNADCSSRPRRTRPPVRQLLPARPPRSEQPAPTSQTRPQESERALNSRTRALEESLEERRAGRGSDPTRILRGTVDRGELSPLRQREAAYELPENTPDFQCRARAVSG